MDKEEYEQFLKSCIDYAYEKYNKTQKLSFLIIAKRLEKELERNKVKEKLVE